MRRPGSPDVAADSRGTNLKAAAVARPERAEIGLAEPPRLFEHRIEDGFKIAGRRVDGLQHLRGRGLLLQRLGQLRLEGADTRLQLDIRGALSAFRPVSSSCSPTLPHLLFPSGRLPGSVPGPLFLCFLPGPDCHRVYAQAQVRASPLVDADAPPRSDTSHVDELVCVVA